MIFGKKRYLFHLLIWITVAILATTQTDDLATGFKLGTSSVSTQKTAGDSIVIQIKPFSKKKVTQKQIVTTIQERRDMRDFLKHNNLLIPIVLGSLVAGVMVYFYLLFVIPYARYRKQKRVLIIGLLLNGFVFFIGLFVTGVIIGFTSVSSSWIDESLAKTIVIYTSLTAGFAAIVTSYFFAIYYFVDLYDEQTYLNRFEEVFTDKVQAETAFLKMQINPHFLFNTLNNIYALSLGKPRDAADITRQLKELVAYMLNDCAQEFVPLCGEIRFLENYIALEKLRNQKDNAFIKLNVHGAIQDQQIAPLLLINFIENAFKHGVKSGLEHAYVKIDLHINGQELLMSVINSKPSREGIGGMEVKQDGGIGIKNVKRRLEILYPRKHKLKITESNEKYTVYLFINL